MDIRCKDILQLPLFKKHSHVIAGQDNLDRPVRWVYLLETMPAFNSIYEWLKGNELLFVTGLYIQDDEYKLLRLIEDSLQAGISGLVIFVDGPYLTHISSEVIDFANQLGLPIITLPWHVKYLDAQESICLFISKTKTRLSNTSDYLNTILFEPIQDEKQLTEQGLIHNIDFTKPFRVLALELYQPTASPSDSYPKNSLQTLLHTLSEHINDYISDFHLIAHSLIHQNSILVVFECSSLPTFSHFTNFLNEHFFSTYADISYLIGIGSKTNKLIDLKQSLKEATQVIQLKRNFSNYLTDIFTYDQLGIYKLFAVQNNEEVFLSLYHDSIAPLVESDRVKDTQLVETLTTFFECDLNIVRAADKLFIHRNTMRYRMRKIEEITGYNLNNFKDCHLLQTGLIIYHFLNKAI